jgi:glycosyltransferase involved in cell wall biosynthesis
MVSPTISFVMPAKNASCYVREAINALIASGYDDWELIVVDSNSPVQ